MSSPIDKSVAKSSPFPTNKPIKDPISSPTTTGSDPPSPNPSPNKPTATNHPTLSPSSITPPSESKPQLLAPPSKPIISTSSATVSSSNTSDISGTSTTTTTIHRAINTNPPPPSLPLAKSHFLFSSSPPPVKAFPHPSSRGSSTSETGSVKGKKTPPHSADATNTSMMGENTTEAISTSGAVAESLNNPTTRPVLNITSTDISGILFSTAPTDETKLSDDSDGSLSRNTKKHKKRYRTVSKRKGLNVGANILTNEADDIKPQYLGTRSQSANEGQQQKRPSLPTSNRLFTSRKVISDSTLNRHSKRRHISSVGEHIDSRLMMAPSSSPPPSPGTPVSSTTVIESRVTASSNRLISLVESPTALYHCNGSVYYGMGNILFELPCHRQSPMTGDALGVRKVAVLPVSKTTKYSTVQITLSITSICSSDDDQSLYALLRRELLNDRSPEFSLYSINLDGSIQEIPLPCDYPLQSISVDSNGTLILCADVPWKINGSPPLWVLPADSNGSVWHQVVSLVLEKHPEGNSGQMGGGLGHAGVGHYQSHHAIGSGGHQSRGNMLNGIGDVYISGSNRRGEQGIRSMAGSRDDGELIGGGGGGDGLSIGDMNMDDGGTGSTTKSAIHPYGGDAVVEIHDTFVDKSLLVAIYNGEEISVPSLYKSRVEMYPNSDPVLVCQLICTNNQIERISGKVKREWQTFKTYASSNEICASYITIPQNAEFEDHPFVSDASMRFPEEFHQAKDSEGGSIVASTGSVEGERNASVLPKDDFMSRGNLAQEQDQLGTHDADKVTSPVETIVKLPISAYSGIPSSSYEQHGNEEQVIGEVSGFWCIGLGFLLIGTCATTPTSRRLSLSTKTLPNVPLRERIGAFPKVMLTDHSCADVQLEWRPFIKGAKTPNTWHVSAVTNMSPLSETLSAHSSVLRWRSTKLFEKILEERRRHTAGLYDTASEPVNNQNISNISSTSPLVPIRISLPCSRASLEAFRYYIYQDQLASWAGPGSSVASSGSSTVGEDSVPQHVILAELLVLAAILEMPVLAYRVESRLLKRLHPLVALDVYEVLQRWQPSKQSPSVFGNLSSEPTGNGNEPSSNQPTSLIGQTCVTFAQRCATNLIIQYLSEVHANNSQRLGNLLSDPDAGNSLRAALYCRFEHRRDVRHQVKSVILGNPNDAKEALLRLCASLRQIRISQHRKEVAALSTAT